MGSDGTAHWGWALSQDSHSVPARGPAGITQLLMKPAVYWVLSWSTAPLWQPGDSIPHFSYSALPLFSCYYLQLDMPAALCVGSTDTHTFFSWYFFLNPSVLSGWKHIEVIVLLLKVATYPAHAHAKAVEDFPKHGQQGLWSRPTQALYAFSCTHVCSQQRNQLGEGRTVPQHSCETKQTGWMATRGSPCSLPTR